MAEEMDEYLERGAAMRRQPLSITVLPDGSFRAEKAGLVGVGPTQDEAIRDLAGKLWIAGTRPMLGEDE